MIFYFENSINRLEQLSRDLTEEEVWADSEPMPHIETPQN